LRASRVPAIHQVAIKPQTAKNQPATWEAKEQGQAETVLGIIIQNDASKQ